MPSGVKRKLAAIMFTDIAGYTALSSKDENRALELLDKQEQILTPIIEKFNGTLHNRIGDGLLFTFPTVTDAIKCGIKIQKDTKEVEDLNLRIGIHEGEITLKNGDVLGDDVNVASRIDPFAAEGGIVISGKVQQNISSLPEFKTKFISEPLLKGVSQEVKIFCIISHGLPETDITKVTAKLEKDVKKLWYNQKSIIKAIAILSILTIGSLLWMSKNNWWFDNNDKPNKFFIHITSDEKYIEDYYSDNLGLITGINWDRDDYLITPVSDSLLKHLHKNIYSKMVSQFHHLDLQIDTYISKEEYEISNIFPAPRKYIKVLLENTGDEEPSVEFLDSLRSIYLPEEPYIKFQNVIGKRVEGFSPDHIIVVNVYNVILKETNKDQGIFYEPHLYMEDNSKRNRPDIPGSWYGDYALYTDNKKLITKIGKVLYGWTYKRAIGTLKVGIINELLDNNLVKIQLFDKDQPVHRNMILENWINYHWWEDGYEKRIEDIELALEYYKKHVDVFDSTKKDELYRKKHLFIDNEVIDMKNQINSLTLELQGYIDGSGRNKGESMSLGWGYRLEVVEVIDDVVLAKITSKRNPYVKVRKGDKVRLVFN